MNTTFETNCDLLYAEFSARENRKNFVIFNNYPETQESDTIEKISNILDSFAKVDTSRLEFTRLGKTVYTISSSSTPPPTRHRPIHIKLAN